MGFTAFKRVLRTVLRRGSEKAVSREYDSLGVRLKEGTFSRRMLPGLSRKC